ncbi:MAG TPA: hypothetical protein VIH90_00225 [Candidatus Saccharimonadales bacterium]
MQTFIVLGLIPGTDIQINFFVWFIFFACLAVGSIIIFANHLNKLHKLSVVVLTRKVLPANQFHIRQQ